MTTSSQTELYLPVRSGFKSDNDLHRRQNRAIEEWAKSPFVTSARIKDAAITTAKIDDLAVTDAKIANLTVTKLTAGTLTADVTVTGLLSAPATTGWRVEIGDATRPIRYWDGATTRFSLDNLGNVSVTGAINATSGTITGNMLVTGLLQSPAATGYRVEIGNATYPFRYWDGTTTRLSVDTGGSVLLTGAITATGGSITGTLDVTGLIRIPATGSRIELGNATFPFRYWDGVNTYLTMNTTGAIVATDIEVQQSGTTTTGLRVVAASDSDADDPAISLENASGDVIWAITNDGRMTFGSAGFGFPGVTFNTLKGSGSNEAIQATGQIRATAEGVATIIAAGGVAGDGDFSVSPANGTIAFTENAGVRKIWGRIAGTWYSATLT